MKVIWLVIQFTNDVIKKKKQAFSIFCSSSFCDTPVLSVKVLQRKRTNTMCIYGERDLFDYVIMEADESEICRVDVPV